MYHRMTIKYLNYRADLNFEVDFGVNSAIGIVVTKWDVKSNIICKPRLCKWNICLLYGGSGYLLPGMNHM